MTVDAPIESNTHPKLIDHFLFVDFEFGAGAQMVQNGVLCLAQLFLTELLCELKRRNVIMSRLPIRAFSCILTNCVLFRLFAVHFAKHFCVIIPMEVIIEAENRYDHLSRSRAHRK